MQQINKIEIKTAEEYEQAKIDNVDPNYMLNSQNAHSTDEYKKAQAKERSKKYYIKNKEKIIEQINAYRAAQKHHLNYV